MSIPLLDRGKYYRGLLILIRKDQIIDMNEREFMIRLGQSLDFDRRFCEDVIEDLLSNPNIKAEPVKFSNRATAKSFLHDAIRLAFVDGKLHPKELSWVKAVARANELNEEWISSAIRAMKAESAEKHGSY